MTGWLPRRRGDRKWEYTLMAAARAEAGFEAMEGYICQSHNIVAQYISA